MIFRRFFLLCEATITIFVAHIELASRIILSIIRSENYAQQRKKPVLFYRLEQKKIIFQRVRNHKTFYLITDQIVINLFEK